MIQAVIFDMDGLLVDSEPVWHQARVAMANRLGKNWTEEDHHAVMGVSTAEWVDYMIKRLELEMSPQTVQDEIAKSMVALYERSIPYMPGAVAAVNFAAANYPTGLASGSIRMLIDTVVQAPELKGKFKAIMSADHVAKGKPSPDVYLATADLLGIAPEHCVCLEDSSNGILAGLNAGMKVIAVPDARFPSKPEVVGKAHVVLSSLKDFSAGTIKTLNA